MDRRFDWKEPLESVSDAMHRVLDDFGSIAEETFAHVGCRPAVALHKDTEGYELRVSVPGVARGDVDVAVEGRTVVVTGSWPASETAEGRTALRDEMPRGRFRRAVHLPEAVQADAVAAQLAAGVLTVRLPLSEPAVRTEVPVEDADEPAEGVGEEFRSAE